MREYDPARLSVKQVMESGALGKPLAFHGSHINSGTLSWRTVEDVVTNSAVHDLHSARWAVGAEIVRVYASHVPYSAGRPDTARLMLLQFRNSAVGLIKCNMEAGYGYDVDVKLTGERGSVQQSSLRGAVVSHQNQRGQWVEEDWLRRFDTAYVDEVQA